MSKKVQVLAVLALCSFVVGTAYGAGAETLSFRSGTAETNGAVVHVLAGPSTPFAWSPFLSLEAEDFAAAQAADLAKTINGTLPAGWVAKLNADPSAEWVNVTGSNSSTIHEPSALYAVKIVNKAGYTDDATLVLYFAVDNQLGWENDSSIVGGVTAPVYLNGVALTPGVGPNGETSSATVGRGRFNPANNQPSPLPAGTDYALYFSGLTLNEGDNWIYFNAPNAVNSHYANGVGGSGGILFSGTFSFTPVPEPMTMSLLGLGGLALLRRKR